LLYSSYLPLGVPNGLVIHDAQGPSATHQLGTSSRHGGSPTELLGCRRVDGAKQHFMTTSGMGGSSRSGSGRWIPTSARARSNSGGQRCWTLASLVQKKGSIRLAIQRGVRVCKKWGQRGSRSSAFSSSSLQIQTRVSSFPPCYRARERFMSSGRVRWWCEGEMGWQR
jgi:hypothetical protein